MATGTNVPSTIGVIVLASTREIDSPGQRASTLGSGPVTIQGRSWQTARRTNLPSVIPGADAVMGATALVHADVLANALVAGVPAHFVKELSQACQSTTTGQKAL